MITCASSRSAAGLALPTVLVFALVVALLVGTALQGSVLEARGAAWRWEAARARNLAETALELLLRRTAVRWQTGGEYCPADRYCDEDYPALGALLAEVPEAWTVSLALAPPSVLPALRDQETAVSSARRYRWQRLEARVRIDGPAPVSLAAGLALPTVIGSEGSP